MVYLILLATIFSAGYVIFLSRALYLWSQIPDSEDVSEFLPGDLPGISVVIAVRNEESHIQACLKSIIHGEISHCDFEILVVDDNSSDNTRIKVEECASGHIRYLQSTGSGKKAALTHGVEQATFSLILCTDADCVVPRNWILSHSFFYHRFSQKNLCVGFVLPQVYRHVITRFQWLDFASTMLLTIVGHKYWGFYLGSGAHLSFKKDIFFAVNGYESNNHLASGDDIFLIKKVLEKYPDSLGFMKSQKGVVLTQPEVTWKGLFQQRKRWATKASYVKDFGVIFVQAWVFLWVLLTGLLLASGILTSHIWVFLTGVSMLVIKIIADYLFLNYLARYFSQPEVMRAFIASSLVYAAHILLSGLFAVLPLKYVWKGRITQ